MNELLNPNMTVPGLYRYRIEGIKDPEVAMVKGYYAYNDLEAETIRRLKANHLPVPTDLRQRIIDQLCATLPEGWCSDGSMLSRLGANISHEFFRVVQGTTTLFDWYVSDGRKKVPIQEANRRAAICTGSSGATTPCAFNSPPAGCTNCNKGALSAITQKIVSGQPTVHDASLTSCAICGCDLKAKVHLPLATLQRNLTASQLSQFPPAHSGFPGCWLRPEEPDKLPTP